MPQLPSSSFSFITIFDKNANPKGVVINDTTDYTAIGINPNNVFVYLRVTLLSSNGNSSTFYNNFNNATGNGADLSRSLGSLSTSTIPLPLQTDGNAAFGSYIIEAQYDYLDGLGNDFETDKSYSYDYSWVPPCVTIMERINLSSSNITTTDTTNYGSYINFSRVHTISPPGNAQLPPLNMPVQTTGLAVNVYQNIATGTWSAKVVSIVTYLLTPVENPQIDGLEVIEQLIGCIEFKVVADVDINKLFCCLGDLKKQYEKLQLSNTVKAEIMFEQTIAPLELNITFYLIFMAGGCPDKAALALEKITEISGCGDCACGGDECPTPIPILTGNANLYNVDSPDGSIIVVPEVNGNLTTFNITVNPAIIPKVIQYSATGVDPILVDTVIDPITGNIQFVVSFTRSIPLLENSSVIRVKISNITGPWTLSVDKIFVDSGDNIVNFFANQIVAFTGTTTNADFIAFKYSNFFADNVGTLVPQKFVAQAQINNSSYYGLSDVTVLASIGIQNTCEANILWIENNGSEKGNAMIVRLYNPLNGEILTYGDFAEAAETNIQIMVKVTAQSA
jgi:hypothetical protein